MAKKCDEQLCWKCKKATGGCSWSAFFVPVENWVATPTVIIDDEGEIRSYKITACPLFEKDDRCVAVKEFEKVSFEKLAKMLEVNHRRLRSFSLDKIKSLCAEKKVKIKIIEKCGRRYAYIDNREARK